MGIRRCLWSSTLAFLLANTLRAAPLNETQRGLLQRIQSATSNGIELLRDPESAMLADTLLFGAQNTISNIHTSPTNIALDMLILSSNLNAANALKIEKQLNSIEKLEFDRGSGLFFGWYNSRDLSTSWKNLSAIDNLHLCLALWTLSQTEQLTDATKNKARQLFDRMDFSIFLDKSSQLLRGNFNWTNGAWVAENYFYSHYGSEARILYILGYALNLFKSAYFNLDVALKNLRIEIASENKLLLWDGGAFQLFLPELLIGESQYSPQMKRFFESYSQSAENYGANKTNKQKLPAAFSASFSFNQALGLIYKGQAGLLAFTTPMNTASLNSPTKEEWEDTLTPHAYYLQSLFSNHESWDSFHQLMNFSDEKLSFYEDNSGWKDALYLGSSASNKIVPVQIALDQGMILLSAEKLRSIDFKTSSSRALFNNQQTRDRLTEYYKKLNTRLNNNLLF